MKVSNFALSIIATVFVSGAFVMSTVVVSAHPTSVISIPSSDNATGSGMAISLHERLTSRQARVLGMAYEIAKEDGHKYPQLLQGILMQESKAGEMKSYKVAGQEFGLRTNERYYGVAQIKLVAARAVLSSFPGLRSKFKIQSDTDEEIIAKLIEDDEFNISIASKYLLILKRLGYDTMKQVALAYNQGPGGARGKDANTNKYSRGVMTHIQELVVQ
jgi:hypothetical protein